MDGVAEQRRQGLARLRRRPSSGPSSLPASASFDSPEARLQGQPVRVKPSGSGTPFKLQRLYSTDNLRKTMSCFRVRDSSKRLRAVQAEAGFRRLQITLPGTDLAFTSVATNNGSKHIVRDVRLARSDARD